VNKHAAFHWPDREIGKRESRLIRDEHNALYNSHAELLVAISALAEAYFPWAGAVAKTQGESSLAAHVRNARAAIAKANGTNLNSESK
jgi:hypothetical protein